MKTWQLEDGCELIDIDKGYIVARFYSREDYIKVLEEGPWTVLGHYFPISKWRPKFSPSDHTIATTLVWVRFMEIPLEAFMKNILMGLGNIIGKAIRVDNTTTDVVKGKFSWVCVEMELNKPLLPVVRAFGRVHAVEYEGFYKICFTCRKLGHNMEQCPTSTTCETEGENRTTGLATEPIQIAYTTENPYGPWLLPSYARRRLQQKQARIDRHFMPLVATQEQHLHI